MKIFKTLTITLLCLLSILTTPAQTKSTIKGEIKDNKNNYEIVSLKSVYGNNPTTFVTTNIDKQGHFVIEYMQPEADVFQLIFDNNRNNKLLVCMNPGDNIELLIDGSNLQHLINCRGNKSVILYKQIFDIISSSQTTLDSLNKELHNNQESKFYDNFLNKFNQYHQTNKDIDKYLISVFVSFDSLKQFTQNNTLSKKNTDTYLNTTVNYLKSIESAYIPFENYQENVSQYYNFSTNREKGHQQLYKEVDEYINQLNNRQRFAQTAIVPFMSKARQIIAKRDSIYYENQLSSKKDVYDLSAAISELTKQTDLNSIQKEFAEKVTTANQQHSLMISNIQKRISTIVSVYQSKYNQSEEDKTEQVKSIISNNKDELVTLLFLERYPREQNTALHNDIANTLHARYPKNKLVTEKYNYANSPAGKLAIGAEAPDMEFSNPEGKPKKLSDLRGNIVLIDFWASWCRPCRMENPNVVRLYHKYHKKGFEVYSVSLDRDRNSWARAIADDGLVWENHVSDLGYWQSAGAKLYGVSSIPCTFLLDRDGKILAKNLRGEELHSVLKQIFGE